jgi:6-hydroxycyclohex-1-ene-1-carbonyl-CoA dehydrogenase
MSSSPYRWLMTAPNVPMIREEFDPFSSEPDKVVVEVAGCGVCHTDLGYFYDGVHPNHALPLTLGHEVSGRVVAAGAGAESWLGKAVITPSVISCGQCDACKRGRPEICRSQQMLGNDIHGGFASHIVVPARGLCPIDETRLAAQGLSLPELSVVEVATAPYSAIFRAGVKPGDLAIVNGIGGIGSYCVQVAKAFGATVVAIGRAPAALDAASKCGAALTLNSREMDGKALKGAISRFAQENGLRPTEWFIFECSGTASGQLTAFGLLVHGATFCVVGFTRDKVEIRLSNLMAFDARALGNWGCPAERYPDVLELVLSGKVQVKPFVKTSKLDEINQVFEAAHDRRIRGRTVLVP